MFASAISSALAVKFVCLTSSGLSVKFASPPLMATEGDELIFKTAFCSLSVVLMSVRGTEIHRRAPCRLDLPAL